MKIFFAFVRKEFWHVIRDKRSLIILIGLPIVMMLLFGFALTSEVKNSNVAILDYSKLDIPDSLFFNTTHLNYNGAIRFTGVLKNNLDSLFKFRKS